MSSTWDVVKIERGMTAKRFLEWEAYARIEPFNERRADYRAAMIASVIANVNRDPKKQKKPFTPDDFLLQWDVELSSKTPPAPKKPQTPEEQMNLLTILAYMHANG